MASARLAGTAMLAREGVVGMKRLWLLRHAKAEPIGVTGDDHDRGLEPRGRHQAERLGAHFARRAIRPSLVLCSSARRARETLEPVRAWLGERTPVRFEHDLYLASSRGLLAHVSRIEEANSDVLMVGHNPGLGDLARALAGSGDPAALAELRTRFPTATLAVLRFDVARWCDLAAAGGRLEELVRARDLPPAPDPG